MKKRSFLKNVAGTLLATAVSSSLSVTADAAEPTIEDLCEVITVGRMSILPPLRCGYTSKNEPPPKGGPNVFLKDWEFKFAKGVVVTVERPIDAQNCTFCASGPGVLFSGAPASGIKIQVKWECELRRFALLAQEKGTLTVHPDVDFQEWLLRDFKKTNTIS